MNGYEDFQWFVHNWIGKLLEIFYFIITIDRDERKGGGG